MDANTIARFLGIFIVILRDVITFAIIARVLVSWFSMGQMGRKGKISQMIYDATDPIVNIAKKLPHKIGMIDLSPLIVLFGVDLIARLLLISIANLV